MITVIFGLSASGKSYLSEQLAMQQPHSQLIHSDDYIQFGFEESLYKMMETIHHYLTNEPFTDLIIEGVQCARLLRKWAQQGKFIKADRIIYCECDQQLRIDRHEARGTKINIGFDKTLTKIWTEFLQLSPESKIEFHKL